MEPGRRSTMMTASSGRDSLSAAPRRGSTSSLMLERLLSGKRSSASMIDGRKDIEIIDLRLFDFALPRGEAKIEITYIAVNCCIHGQYSGEDEDSNSGERIVLEPNQVKNIYILLEGCTEMPINPAGFMSSSGSFPMAQTWTRPKTFRYPAEAELTLEVMVKGTRCITQPHTVKLKGTRAFLNYCFTS